MEETISLPLEKDFLYNPCYKKEEEKKKKKKL
jgi:hypothetical protein